MGEHDEQLSQKWNWTSMPKASGIFAVRRKSSGAALFVGVRDIRQRAFDHHQALVRGKHHNRALQAAWTADPSDFEFRVVEYVSAVEFLNAFKQTWISRSSNCFNKRNAVPIKKH